MSRREARHQRPVFNREGLIGRHAAEQFFKGGHPLFYTSRHPQQACLLQLLPPVAGVEVHFATGGFQFCGIGGQFCQPVELFFGAVGVALAQQVTHSRGN